VAQSLSSAAEHSSLSNSAARAGTIRDAVRWIAEHRAEVKALNAEINDFMVKTVKRDLGFKIADFNAIYRVSQLEIEERDALIETLREGFAAIGVGQIVDWVDAAQATPGRRGTAPADDNARRLGHEDGLSGGHDHADEYPQGQSGNGHADGAGDTAASRRGRGRPRKRRQEAEAGAEF
jgi:hypothetical protein